MASEIRVNSINNRSGLGTVTIADNGIVVSGIVTAMEVDAASDITLKQNIKTVENALDKVVDLRGVKFDWKDNGRTSYGVIAQELENVLPELVNTADHKTVNYNGIIGVLIEAVKELSQRLDDLENNR